jgi:hypothetical protein
MRRKALALLLPLLLALSATPASAADAEAWTKKCYDGLGNDRKIDLPGKTDLNIFVPPCVYRSGSKLYAVVELLTAEAEIPAVGSGHKFDGFLVTATLERHKNGESADRDQILKLASCDYKDEVNSSWGVHLYCKTDVYTGYSSDYEYSADGWLKYDTDNDGKGWLPVMQLTGSPVIH